jgi:radical SAM superfamily enzyme YgiQ (UPF0313 family)
VLELFAPAGNDYFRKVNRAVRNYNIQWSPDSADEDVRRAFGKGYANAEIESTIESALSNGCRRLDMFFMVGLPKQTYSSVMQTATYLRGLLTEYGQDRRVLPFISPLAPFVDPGSKAYENPEQHGYRVSYRTLEEHRQALQSPSWKYMLNYDTEWLSRDEIVMSTYEVALAFNDLKKDHGLIAASVADGVEGRARGAMEMMRLIDRIVADHGPDSPQIAALKPEVDRLSSSSICQKREMNWPATSFVRSAPRIFWAFARGSAFRYGA